jgi:hypothetical protein
MVRRVKDKGSHKRIESIRQRVDEVASGLSSGGLDILSRSSPSDSSIRDVVMD